MFGSAGEIHVLEHVAAAVNPGALAIPHCKHPVVFRITQHLNLLRTPDRGGGQLFVDAGLEFHMVCLKVRLLFPPPFLKAPERGAAIAGDETRSVETISSIAP